MQRTPVSIHTVLPPTARTYKYPVLAVLTCAIALAGCAGGPGSPLTLADLQPAAATSSPEQPKSELQKAAQYWGDQYQKNPTDAQAAINYARNLKALGAKEQALGVLQASHQSNPTNKTLNSELGRLALEQDQVSAAQKLLEQADDPVNSDWKTVSARGTVLAKQGKYREAISYFERARQMAPEQGTILNNLALAHAMDGRADKAESMLRDALAKAPGDDRISHNLSLVLSLQGKHDASKTVMANAAAQDEVSDDAAFLKKMVKAEPQKASTQTAAGKAIHSGVPSDVSASAAPAQGKSAAVTGKAAISTASLKPAPGKSMAAPLEDAAVTVQKLADQHTGQQSNQPIDLTQKR